MNDMSVLDFEKEAERLRRIGLNDEKVIEDLIIFRSRSPQIMKKKYPTEMYDKVNLMCRNYMDRLARFEMDYDFRIDVEKFINVSVACLETVPLLHSQVINNPINPYWKVVDYSINDFVCVEEVDDISKVRQNFFERQIPLKNNVQMNIGVFICEGRSHICFIWNHMLMDGGGFKMFWQDFCKNYTDYVSKGISPVNFSNGTRKYSAVYKDMTSSKAKLAKAKFANVSPKYNIAFPFNDKSSDSIIIVSRKIEKEFFINAKKYAKSQCATITDLLIAVYIESLSNLISIPSDDKVSVSCATDLRRHIKDLSDIGYTNHVSFMHCELAKKGKDIHETIKLVSNKMKELKNDEFVGLHGLPLLNIAYKTMIYLQAESIVKLFYNNPVFSVSNVGIIEPSYFVLDEKGPFDAFVAGAAKNKPCAVMTALTINDKLSVSMCLRGNEEDKVLLEKFFSHFERIIKSL